MSGPSEDRAVLAFVGLGSNLDSPAGHIRSAMDELGALPGTRVVARSSLYRTAPIGHVDQPDFVNAVAGIETSLTAAGLLAALLGIEGRHGRVRTVSDGPRTLDLDLLLYGDHVIDAPGLVVPHPRMHHRGFVIAPLAEIAPALTFGAVRALPALAARLCAEQRVERLSADALA